MTSHEKYLDELLHDAWIPLPPVVVDDTVVLQCHRDADKRRSYFRVSLTACVIRGFDDPDENAGMKVLGVAVNEAGELCLEGVQGGELRLGLPEAIKHVAAGSVDDNRSWTAKLGLSDDSLPPLATEVVPVVDAFDVAPDMAPEVAEDSGKAEAEAEND